MKLIPPIAVTPAMLVSSVPETDYAAWSNLTTYAVGNRVIRLHRIYENVIAGSLDHDPAAAGPGFWFDVGPTNRWAMFATATGARTTAAATITVTLTPGVGIDALGLVDLTAASVRVQISEGGPDLYDQTINDPPPSVVLLDLPETTAPTVIVTITPAGGTAAVGKLIIGNAVDLGSTENGPTVTLTDFSRRETDDYGATTVVERSWAKRVALRSRIPSTMADEVQRRLVAVRTTPALWVGEEGFEALTLYGFYKEFSVDLALSDASFLSLTIEGLPEVVTAAAIGDPSPSAPSDLKVLRPLLVDDTVLTSSTIAETDYPAWNAVTNYAAGARVIKTATHRIYESAVGSNVGHDPATGAVQWIDVGPTNRTAMFDQALGTASTKVGSIQVQLTPGSAVTALAVLDTDAATVRVQAPGGYDQTKATTVDGVTVTELTFLDLAVAAGANITVTISAASGGVPVSAGTLLIGTIELLGLAETSPTVGINDYSRKVADDFGNTVPVERAWAKRMAMRSLVSTSAADGLLRRMASLRATPALWIGQEGFDSLTVYGFYRDFSIEIAENISTCTLNIEGLSKAVQLPAPEPLINWVGDWEDDESYPRNAIVRHERRSFASLVDNNLGNEPPTTATDNAFWYLVSDRGDDGAAGSNGVPGPPGPDGQPSYIHFAWANSADGSTGFSTTVSAGKLYLGLYSDFTLADSSNPADYQWTKIKGEDGLQGSTGTPGAPGANGQTPYFHIAYADSSNGVTNFTTGAPGSRIYIGTLVDYVPADSTNPADYIWSKYVGADGSNGTPGAPGANGQPSYVHFAWANASDGSTGFSTTVSAGKLYIGVYADQTLADSSNPASYHWTLIKGADGSNGVPGPPGPDGQPTYVHTAYSTAADGSTGFHVSDPTGRTYLGVYTDQTLADSTNPADYTWSLIKGADGSPGAPGAPGTPALSVSTSPASITVPCTAAGTPKAAIPGSQITAYSGTTPVTASASYSFTSSGVTGPAVSSSGAVSITGMVADHGYVEVTVSYGGASQIVKVTYDKSFDGAPYVYDTTAVGAPATTSYATVASISLLMGPNGSITMDTNGGFEINAGTINVLGTLEYSLNGGGSWTNANSFTGNAAPPFSQGDWSASAGLSGATIGLTTRQTVMFRVTMRKNNTNNFAAFGGDFAVSWSA